MRVYKKHTNANWRQENEDTIAVAVTTNGTVVHVYAWGRFGAGYLYMHNWTWPLEDILHTFPQLWLAELREKGVQI